MSVKTLKSWVLVSIAAVTVGVAAASAAGALAESVTGITTDATVRTTGHHSLSATGGVEATVATLTLPAGNWILHSDDSIVAGGTSDVVRCWIVVTSKSVHVGHGTDAGTGSGKPFIATISDTAAVTLTASTVVKNTCSHDNTTGSAAYFIVDPDATLWAHKSTSLVSTTAP